MSAEYGTAATPSARQIMADVFAGVQSGLDSPAANAAAVTPGATELPFATRALYIGETGDITVTMAGGGSVTFANVTGMIPIRVTHVTAATATGIVAVW